MGKGSARRPRLASREEYEKNWESVFGRKSTEAGVMDVERRGDTEELPVSGKPGPFTVISGGKR